MLVTEKQAREKACPFARAIEGFTGPDGATFAAGVNRSLDGKLPDDVRNNMPFCRCIASDCMAWRAAGEIGTGPNGEARTRDMDGRTQWHPTGYCGLAGPAKQKGTQK